MVPILLPISFDYLIIGPQGGVLAVQMLLFPKEPWADKRADLTVYGRNEGSV